MLQLQQDLAVKEEKYAEAQAFKTAIFAEMTNNIFSRLVVAMESALADGRYEDAARARDEYRRLLTIRSDELLRVNRGVSSTDQGGIWGSNGDNAKKFNF